ncbi:MULTISPECIES: 2-hydroxyacyl-CoA dehydratase subunit D [Clostridium]|jgi:bcr-type benzoyl-CoA reductase subunit C|uniref:2-hydroxyacyl-CoA dehydratase n=3 Tax=Clostridium TaxID=1485 RepID=A0A7U4LN69_CLOSG|nr:MULTISPECIES: 2-hydroxyacyl-CoA dehydratase family protein [Clostridium]AVP60374.1 2-hydroxyacyl-CoA dehydratase [Clostridium botulinum]AKC62949.1 benzoyl-CoA reductase/2-hydroxyglutaryl-CoA dehydratase subunit, BcrC/BadD/HgdB [Clostridium sporogenes]AKJ90186.1 phenyllactate dehydratase [Clostridium sporogenes]AVP63780.1 2-hydroxyacyl-CoA dehydratase [Clostridium botulinum]EDU36590.1 R-phenyllactate dehydratase, small subunit [Clostridium sporogenes ATCC 15579]
MDNIKNILSKLEGIVKNPKKVVSDYKERTGNKVIGCFPVYTPEEIVYAADMLPIGIWGGDVEANLAKQYYPAFCCSIMQSCMEFGLKGIYEGLSAVIIPGMCDTLNCMGQNWKFAIKDIPYIALVHPQNRKLEAGVEYLVEEYKHVKAKIEEIRGKEITEEEMQNSIDIYNEHRKVMRSFVDEAAKHPNTINNYQRNLVIKSGFFMRKDEHTKIVKELNELLAVLPEEKYDGKKVLVTGILLDSKEMLDVFEENKLRIVADDLAQESRQFRTDVPEGKNALDRLARQWSNIEGCSLAYDPKKIRGSMIAKEAKAKGIDGVVFAMMKFCDPEEYDYPIVKKDIEKEDIPTTMIEVDQQNKSVEQIRTRIQTFSEIL